MHFGRKNARGAADSNNLVFVMRHQLSDSLWLTAKVLQVTVGNAPKKKSFADPKMGSNFSCRSLYRRHLLSMKYGMVCSEAVSLSCKKPKPHQEATAAIEGVSDHG